MEENDTGTIQKVKKMMDDAVQKKASDIFIVAGKPAGIKTGKRMENLDNNNITPEISEGLVYGMYLLADRNMDILKETGDDDFSFAIHGLARFRVNAFKQRGTLAAVVRIVHFSIPDPEDIGIPDSVINTANLQKGLVLITGPAGSGKSTTLACIIHKINIEAEKHIITLEDPIEYLHRHGKSTVTQREISIDTESYASAIRSAIRQSPDVILLGEMRDYEAMSAAITAAETGHLVFSTLHTSGCANSIDRIIDSFPPEQQRQISLQLSMVLQSVISQQLIPDVNGGVVPAFEIMTATTAIKNMIREQKLPQINGFIASSSNDTIMSMDSNLISLYKKGKISKDTALAYSENPEIISKRL